MKNQKKLFFFLTILECIIGITVYLSFPSDPQRFSLFGFSYARLGLISLLSLILLFAVIGFIGHYQKNRFSTFLNDAIRLPLIGFLLPIPLVFVMIIGLLLKINPLMIERLLPILFVYWVICIQFYFLLYVPKTDQLENDQKENKQKKPLWLLLFGVCIFFSYLIIPAKLPTILDGIPLNMKWEFSLVIFIIPFLIFIYREFLINKSVLFIASLLLVIRLFLYIFLPPIGLDIQIFRDADAATGWERSYYSIIEPHVTEVMRQPYLKTLEFPLEWVNQRRFDLEEDLSFRLDFSGFLHLPFEGKLTFNIQGAEKGEIILYNHLTDEERIIVIANGSSENQNNIHILNNGDSLKAHIRGRIYFPEYKDYQFAPILTNQEGNQASAFQEGVFWREEKGLEISRTNFWILKFTYFSLDIVYSLLIVLGIIFAIIRDIKLNRIMLVDAFLMGSACAIFAITQHLNNEVIGSYLSTGVLIFGIVRCFLLKGNFQAQKLNMSRVFVYSIGFSLLVIFLRLDINQLKEVFLFTAGQDNFAYQVYARNIFVKGDFFLLETPPHAYKLLYPYLVGLLHIVFGQSSAAQFFFNAWCAFFITYFFIHLIDYENLPVKFIFFGAVFLLYVYLIQPFYKYFFRFGLIEPVATVCLMACLYFAVRKRWKSWLAVGILGVLLRLDYIIAIGASLILFINVPFTNINNFKIWTQKIFKEYWKRIFIFILLITIIPAGIIAYFQLSNPNYVLNASDTKHTGLSTITRGWMRILLGGTPSELQTRLSYAPVQAIVITLSLSGGLLVGIMGLLLQNKLKNNYDFRWFVILIGFFIVYVFVKPTGYSPRFSTPLLPLSFISIAQFINMFYQSKNRNHQEK